MPTKFNMTRDISGSNGFGVDICLDSYSGLLATGVAQSQVTPSDYDWYIAVFTYTPGANVFVNCKSTAAAPAGAIGASQSVLVPSALRLAKGTTISFITPDAAGSYITIRFFVAPPWTN